MTAGNRWKVAVNKNSTNIQKYKIAGYDPGAALAGVWAQMEYKV
jgi:hypothetical protein